MSRASVRHVGVLGGGLIGMGWASLFAARGWFAELFSDEPAVLEETVTYLAISVWGYAGFGVLIVVNGALNAIDKASRALALSITRVLLAAVTVWSISVTAVTPPLMRLDRCSMQLLKTWGHNA